MGCSSNSPDDLIEPLPNIELVSYNANIKSIIDTNCIFCHNNPPVNGANTSMVTYNDVQGIATLILDRVSLQAGETGAMPLGGPRLPQQSIDLIQQWIDDGLLEE